MAEGARGGRSGIVGRSGGVGRVGEWGGWRDLVMMGQSRAGGGRRFEDERFWG